MGGCSNFGFVADVTKLSMNDIELKFRIEAVAFCELLWVGYLKVATFRQRKQEGKKQK